MNLNSKKNKIKETFDFFEDPMDKYIQIIEMGKKNDGISENLKNDEYRIFGCTSMAWVKVEKNEEKYYINTDSDTFIVKGLLSILKTLIDGSTIDEINSLDAESIFIDIGLKDSITSQRTNGFMNALKTIQKQINGK